MTEEELQRAAAQIAACEARIMAALVPIVMRSASPGHAVQAAATVVGRMLGMGWQAGCFHESLGANAKHIEDLMRLGLAQQLGGTPGFAALEGRG